MTGVMKVLIALGVFLASFASTHFSMASQDNKLTIGVVVPAPPKFVFQVWQPVADYLKATTGMDAEIKIIKGFDRIKSAVQNNEIDVFYADAYIFYLLSREDLIEPVVQVENLLGSIMTRSAVFAHRDSGVKTLQDLKTRKVAFVDPASLGGYVAPRALFHKNGINTKTDVEEVFTRNLESALHKTLLQDVAAGSMCALKFKLMSRKIEVGDLQTIALSDEYPENLLAAPKSIARDKLQKISEAFRSLDSNKPGQEVLKGMAPMKIKRFVAYDPVVLDVIRKLTADAGI
ncbi:MAG: phosphate/phosphite/phosphonate ABC transporter substrate-binding protein [Gammaproteobacteria bacterium]|nr:phosphate/phosphite/phosphonate ABC transporter substrate-binding protein [Gammaproteobacteria bacterium]